MAVSSQLPKAESSVLSNPERRWRAVLTLGWPLAMGVVPILMSMGEVPLCVFRRLSGLPCPLCGATHACAALIDGDLLTAWQANPGVIVLVAIALTQTVQLAYEAWSARRLLRWRIGPEIWSGGLVVLALVWLMRLAG
ncbi:hypothetical protein BH11PSE11_BH11PSE11_14720 [soil metagenome]